MAGRLACVVNGGGLAMAANGGRLPLNGGLGELRTVVTSMPRVEKKKEKTKNFQNRKTNRGPHRTLFCFGRLFCHTTQEQGDEEFNKTEDFTNN